MEPKVLCSAHYFWRAYNMVLIGFPPPDIDLREWLVPSGSVSSDQSAA